MSKKNTAPEENLEEILSAEEEAAETAQEETESEEAEAACESESEEEADIDPLQKQYNELNDQHLRLAAEYANFRKRSARERDQVHADAVAFAVSKLLPTFDNLERALAQPTEDAEYKKGIELIFKQLTEALAGLQVTAIEDSPGTRFDPNLHNAVMHIEDDELAENVIAEVFQHGFQIGEKVIRHSMVKVAN